MKTAPRHTQTTSSHPLPASVAVIGAGIAGLTCARKLVARGYQVTIYEKSRRPGGRVSTRRTAGFAFNHGAQYVTAEDSDFSSVIGAARQSGAIAPWDGRLVALANGITETIEDDRTRWVGVPGMSAWARHLANDLDVRCGYRIAAIEHNAPSWRLVAEDGAVVGEAHLVVVAVPAPQAISLLAVSPELAGYAAEAMMEPCWAVMAGFANPLALPFDGAFVRDGALAWIARDRSKSNFGTGESWVLHASPKWSQDHLEGDRRAIAGDLLNTFRRVTGVAPPRPVFLAAHRWRYARAQTPAGPPCLFDPERGIGACGDWCLGGKIEAAFLSGRAMADRIVCGRSSSAPGGLKAIQEV